MQYLLILHNTILVHDVINLLYYEHWTDKNEDIFTYSITCWSEVVK